MLLFCSHWKGAQTPRTNEICNGQPCYALFK